jgi:ABC-type nitrate/sulfonate/bicarbonate transport system ATPase subunit
VEKYCIEIILATTNLIEAVYLSDQIFLMSKNPATIIFELNNQNKYDDIQTMVNSDSFRLISKQVQSKFQDSSGIGLIHYSI